VGWEQWLEQRTNRILDTVVEKWKRPLIKKELDDQKKHSIQLWSHSNRLMYATFLATMGDPLQSTYVTCAAMHDTGKKFLRKELVEKSGLYTAEERLEMRQHPDLGHEYLWSLGLYNESFVAGWHHAPKRYVAKNAMAYADKDDLVNLLKLSSTITAQDVVDAAITRSDLGPGLRNQVQIINKVKSELDVPTNVAYALVAAQPVYFAGYPLPVVK
jgi:hypothetical protein